MLTATHQGQVWVYKPGQPILHDGMNKEQFFIIRNGQVQVTYQDENCADKFTTMMADGDYFGQAAFQLNGWRSEININAIAEGEVEVLALSSQFFLELMSEAIDTRRDIIQYTHNKLTDQGAV